MDKCECRDSKLITIVRELKYRLQDECKFAQFELLICENCSGISTEPEGGLETLIYKAPPAFLDKFQKFCNQTQELHKAKKPFKVYRENGDYVVGVE